MSEYDFSDEEIDLWASNDAPLIGIARIIRAHSEIGVPHMIVEISVANEGPLASEAFCLN